MSLLFVGMSARPAETNQDELESVMISHRRECLNLGRYENIGKAQAPDGRGLVRLVGWITAVLQICPLCNIGKGQFTSSAIYLNKQKAANYSGLPTRKWASARAERWVTVLNHVRRLYNNPEQLASVLRGLPKRDQDRLKKLFRMIRTRDDEDSDGSDGGDGGSDSDVSTDDLGIPNILRSPTKSKHKGPEEEPLQLDDTNDDDVDLGVDPADPADPAAAPTKMAKKSPHLPVKKEPLTEEITTSTVHDTIGGAFDVVITYATKQSYFHHVDNEGKKTFMCAKGGQDHQQRMRKLMQFMKKQKWKKGMKADKVKAVAKTFSGKF